MKPIQIYDRTGEFSKFSPKERFEILKKAGYIPSEEEFENWTVEEYDIKDLKDLPSI